MSLIDILNSMSSYVLNYFQGAQYIFQVIFNLPIGGVPLGYIVIVLIAIRFLISLVKFIVGGDS